MPEEIIADWENGSTTPNSGWENAGFSAGTKLVSSNTNNASSPSGADELKYTTESGYDSANLDIVSTATNGNGGTPSEIKLYIYPESSISELQIYLIGDDFKLTQDKWVEGYGGILTDKDSAYELGPGSSMTISGSPWFFRWYNIDWNTGSYDRIIKRNNNTLDSKTNREFSDTHNYFKGIDFFHKSDSNGSTMYVGDVIIQKAWNINIGGEQVKSVTIDGQTVSNVTIDGADMI